jgi:hypothetical protein
MPSTRPPSSLPTGRNAAFAVLAACALGASPVAQTPQQVSLAVAAVAQTSPPALAFSWPLDPTATSYSVARRVSGVGAWGAFSPIPGGGAITSWTDTSVVAGTRYDYLFSKIGSPSARGFLTAGIEAAAIENRGRLILLVDATKAAGLGARLDRLVEDLTGDGWLVMRHDVLPTDTVLNVKTLIQNDANTYFGQIGAVFVLGHVPVPYSGQLAPDGHGDHVGAWAADGYYGEVEGNWTDSFVNTTSASRPQNWNVPFDGKPDNSSLPSDLDFAVGRVDFAGMPAFAASELALLQQYLDKDHDYRHKAFSVEQRAVIDDNFGWFSGEAFAASGWRNFYALVGAGNVVAADYFTTLNTTSGGGHAWSYGCGGGTYTSAGGIGSTANFVASTNRNVFTMLFGSYFGDWDSTDNFLRASLCSGWTLASAWAGRPHWSFHPMGLGETIGACARLSQNDTSAGGIGARQVHMGLMGDPTLRQHVIAPPANVAVTDLWPQAGVSWSASPDAVAGYHVYRAASPAGPFTRLNATAVTGTSFVDAAALSGSSTYVVRALRLETTPGGTYWNLSQGAFATVALPQQAASHTSYGTGCYAISDSFHQYFATPAAAAAALDGRSITLSPSGGGYLVTAGGGTFVAPGAGASALALGDDDQVAVVPSTPFPCPGGAAATLHVHSNGIVGASPLQMSPAASAVPTVATLLGEAATAWYCWHDYDPTEPGAGAIRVEEAGGTLYVTWDGVESHPGGTANVSTLQFQFELATGVVRYVWHALATTGTGQQTAPSEQHLIGWSPGGSSVDAGPVDLATALPLLVGSVNLEPLRLAAAPAPVSTPSAGTLVTYAIDHVPELAPGSRAGFTILGLVPDLAGSSLATMGMPGCTRHLGSLDVFLFFAGSSPSLTSTFAIPPGVPGGLTVYATAIAFVPPGSLPNGQNAFGAVVSNGVASFVNDH